MLQVLLLHVFPDLTPSLSVTSLSSQISSLLEDLNFSQFALKLTAKMFLYFAYERIDLMFELQACLL